MTMPKARRGRRSPDPSIDDLFERIVAEPGASIAPAQESIADPIDAAPSGESSVSSAEMHQTALVFLDDPIARKLAVAWASCRGDEGRWLNAAGLVPSVDTRTLCAALRINGICRDGGITDRLALRYIAVALAKNVASPGKKGRRHGR